MVTKGLLAQSQKGPRTLHFGEEWQEHTQHVVKATQAVDEREDRLKMAGKRRVDNPTLWLLVGRSAAADGTDVPVGP